MDASTSKGRSARVKVRRGMWRWRLGVAGFAALLAITIAAPGSAATRLFRLTGQVERITGPAAMRGAQILPQRQLMIQLDSPVYYLLRGTTSGDRVKFAFTLEATAGVPVAAMAVAYDKAGTSQVLAVGRPTKDSLARLAKMRSDAQARSSIVAPSNGISALATWRSTHGFFSTFWTDPIGLTVNSVIDEAHWQYNGSKVRSLTGNDGRQWLTANGWSEISHSIAAYYNAASTVGTVYTNDHFETRSWFPCPHAADHDTWYSANNAYGFADGHIGGGVNTWATGACKGLLSVTAFASPGA